MANDNPAIQIELRCACGAATVRVNGRPLSMLMCACEDCQKATGTGHSAVALFKTDAVTMDGNVRRFERPANSGATFQRRFCPQCGTPLGGASSGAPAITMLPVGLFGKHAGWYRPGQLIFARSHLEWDLVDATLPRWQTYRDEEGRS